MQTETGALKNHLSLAIDQFLRDLASTVMLAGDVPDRPNNKPNPTEAAKNGSGHRLKALMKPLAAEFQQMAARWREEKLQALTDAAGLHLIDMVETLSERMMRLTAETRPTAPDSGDVPLAADAADAPENISANSANGTDSCHQPSTGACRPAGDSPNGLKGGLNACRGMSPGMLTHRALTSFLETHGFQRDSKQTGECVYRHASGACLSIPPYHPGREIAKGTAGKLLRQIGAILHAPARMMGGQIVVAHSEN